MHSSGMFSWCYIVDSCQLRVITRDERLKEERRTRIKRCAHHIKVISLLLSPSVRFSLLLETKQSKHRKSCSQLFAPCSTCWCHPKRTTSAPKTSQITLWRWVIQKQRRGSFIFLSSTGYSAFPGLSSSRGPNCMVSRRKGTAPEWHIQLVGCWHGLTLTGVGCRRHCPSLTELLFIQILPSVTRIISLHLGVRTIQLLAWSSMEFTADILDGLSRNRSGILLGP